MGPIRAVTGDVRRRGAVAGCGQPAGTDGFLQIHNLEGGLQACKRAGLEVIVEHRVIPIVRQVMLVAGSMVLLGWHRPGQSARGSWWLDLMVGCGMVFAGNGHLPDGLGVVEHAVETVPGGEIP